VYARRLRELLECYNLDVRNNDPIHMRSWCQLDVVVTRREQSCSAVTTYDAGFSDHKLLTWAVDGSRADPPAVTVNYCPRRAVSMEDLRAALNASSLCMRDQWTSVDDLALLHDTVFTELADRFAPLRQVTHRP